MPAALSDSAQNGSSFIRNFWTDAVAGKNCDFQLHINLELFSDYACTLHLAKMLKALPNQSVDQARKRQIQSILQQPTVHLPGIQKRKWVRHHKRSRQKYDQSCKVCKQACIRRNYEQQTTHDLQR